MVAELGPSAKACASIPTSNLLGRAGVSFWAAPSGDDTLLGCLEACGWCAPAEGHGRASLPLQLVSRDCYLGERAPHTVSFLSHQNTSFEKH